MTPRQIKAYMEAATVFSKLSYCERRKVGCVVVKKNNIISIGYNGTPAGTDNTCEDENFKTKATVIHAEKNALTKVSLFDATGASLFVTTAPCLECAKLIKTYAIKEVFYLDEYNHIEGLDYLITNGIKVERVWS